MKLITQMVSLRGEIELPSDKSISHRAVMLASLAKGTTQIRQLLMSEDVKATLLAFQKLGVKMTWQGEVLEIEGRNFQLTPSSSPLDMGNSGTTTRLMMGILASQGFSSQLEGDTSLSERPMNRVTEPLSQMGADIHTRSSKVHLPLTIKGGQLHALDYKIPMASAQVKTALIFAALRAQGTSHLTEIAKTRDHTEKMLPLFGGEITIDGLRIGLTGPQELTATQLIIPGDFSSAAFWIVAALIVPGSSITLRKVGINPTRTGLLDVVRAMGAQIELSNYEADLEMADLHVSYCENLTGTVISGDLIPRCIDELPILSLLASQAKGETLIKDAQELRFKESDRISSIVSLLSQMGANITENPDGLRIVGKSLLSGTQLADNQDHRLMMTAIIASLITRSGNDLPDNAMTVISTSYPTFFEDLDKLCHLS